MGAPQANAAADDEEDDEDEEEEEEQCALEKPRLKTTIFAHHKFKANYGLADFTFLKVLGRGAYGKVCCLEG
jgi:hypothetical protein